MPRYNYIIYNDDTLSEPTGSFFADSIGEAEISIKAKLNATLQRTFEQELTGQTVKIIEYHNLPNPKQYFYKFGHSD